MMVVKLFATDGTELVAADIPTFGETPDVVTWHERVFVRDAYAIGEVDTNGVLTTHYRETRPVVVPAPGAHGGV